MSVVKVKSEKRRLSGGVQLATHEAEIIERLRYDIESGRPWHLALLEAIGRWQTPEEKMAGRKYRYLLSGEAFDWLLLAERLVVTLDGVLSAEERERMLFHGKLPEGLNTNQIKELLGVGKHRAVLNFWYGVVVEQALQLAVEEEVRRERRSKGLPDNDEAEEEVYRRLYDATQEGLLTRFRQEMSLPQRDEITLTELNEFTYWLFKGRLKIWDPARIASDTRKGLRQLHRLRGTTRPY
jgi:hypothetical protein